MACDSYSHKYEKVEYKKLTISDPQRLWFWQLECSGCGRRILKRKTEEEHRQEVEWRRSRGVKVDNTVSVVDDE